MSDVDMHRIEEDSGTSQSDEDNSDDNIEDGNPFFDEPFDNAEDIEPTQTSFDHYFALVNRKLQTSSNVFSRAVPPIDRETFFKVVQRLKVPKDTQASLDELHASFKEMMPNYALELSLGYNLMFYGYGSKRIALNEFAKYCAKLGHVFVANGFLPDFSLKAFLAKVDVTLDITSPSLDGTVAEAHCRRLCEFLTKPTSRPVILLFHNIDSIGIRDARAKKCVQLLNGCSKIHIVASMDNIAAPLMWADTSPIFETDRPPSCDASSKAISWLWHDCTTLQPYDVELANIDRTSFAGAHAFKKSTKPKAGVGAASAQGPITETAAQHVLASVTEKAKKLFMLLGQRQVEAMASSDAAQPQEAGMSYERLFSSARNDFIATNDTALKALLSEFRDHSMIVGANASEGGEVLWIPMSKESLIRILRTLETS